MENITPRFHKVAKYVIIPGVHDPLRRSAVHRRGNVGKGDTGGPAPGRTGRQARYFGSWIRARNKDTKALDFYLKAGNEMMSSMLNAAAGTEIGYEWAAKTAKDNPWFARVVKSQQDSEEASEGTERWRTIRA